MIAALQMYDLPEVRVATDAFWAALAQRLELDLPLSRPQDWTSAWHRQDLIFSQTCGYPFTHAFAGKLKLVATPLYDADGCDGPRYCSIIFAREKTGVAALRGKTAAFNNRDSMSGMLALQLVFAPLAQDGRFFGSTVETGGHMASMAAVQKGEADVCAIDCVTVAYARRYRPSALEGLVEIARSPLVPALPFVTVAGNVAALRKALHAVFADRATVDVRRALLLDGVSILPAEEYNEILALEAVMEQRGGLSLW